MPQTQKEIKQRYFDRVYAEAPEIDCKCGCGQKLKSRDKYARPQEYINGHNGRKYDDPTQYKREWNHRNRPARQEAKMSRHRMLKVKLIEQLGNKCAKCSLEYNGKNAAIYHFHHRNPPDKTFAVGNQLTVKAWETILTEVAKCDLLCANCHELTHSEEF